MIIYMLNEPVFIEFDSTKAVQRHIYLAFAFNSHSSISTHEAENVKV